MAGSVLAPYGADTVAKGKPVLLTEGVFDALLARQAAGDLVTPLALLSAVGGRAWAGRMAALPVPLFLLCFDADDAGERAALYWLARLPRVRRWRPFRAKDVTDMWAAGGDELVTRWVLAGLAAER